MKKILALILAMALVLALAACGETKEAEVVENVDPNNNNIVIETPPAVVSGTGNNAGTYTPDTRNGDSMLFDCNFAENAAALHKFIYEQ